MNGYPSGQRCGVWALDFLKVVHRAGIAKELGSAAVCLISEVALAEHAKDYMMPPDFWNGQLKDACGLHDEDTFVALRRRCERAGWLVYQRGSYPGAAGRYWVQVPPGLSRMIGSIPVKPGQHPGKHPGKHPGQHPGQDPGQDPGQHPGQDPGQHPGKHPGKHPGSSTPYPNPSLPHPPPPTAGVGVGGGDPWLTLKDRRERIEAMLDALQVATGPKATGRWIEALKSCKRVRTMADAEACLRECVGKARAAGESVNYASEVADRIRRWKPTEAQP